MPREQGHFREAAPHSTSKTAKDKSNANTLQASQGAKSELNKHMLRRHSERDSEKDSGYSEASSDDQRSSRSKPARENGKNHNGKIGNATGARRSPYELPPIYVIKNLLVKPSAPEQLLHGPLSWGGGWHKPQPQLLLIQQPTVSTPPSSAQTPPSCLPSPQGPPRKGGGGSNQSHSSRNSYLPILNSYPRIAPHPRKDTHEAKGATWAKQAKESGGEGQSQSKRACIEEEKWDLVSTTSDLQRSPQQPSRSKNPVQRKAVRGNHVSSSSTQQQSSGSTQQQSSGRDGVGSPSISSSQTPSPPSLSDSPSSSSPPSSSLSSSTTNSPRHSAVDSSNTRQRRFLNTAEILNQSGLLAITLRTKELLKQNAATDRELAELRQHTQLLCQAAWGGRAGPGARAGPGGKHWCDKSPNSLDKLVQAMSESGSYPGLHVEHLRTLGRTRDQENQKDRHGRSSAVHSSCPAVMSSHNIDDGTAPPSPLFAPSPAPPPDPSPAPTECPLDSSSCCVSFQRPPPEHDDPPAVTRELNN